MGDRDAGFWCWHGLGQILSRSSLPCHICDTSRDVPTGAGPSSTALKSLPARRREIFLQAAPACLNNFPGKEATSQGFISQPSLAQTGLGGASTDFPAPHCLSAGLSAEGFQHCSSLTFPLPSPAAGFWQPGDIYSWFWLGFNATV